MDVTSRSAHTFHIIMIVVLSLALLSNLWPIAPKKSIALSALQIGVYSDPTCTNEVLSIDWGELTPGSNKEFSIFVRNDDLNKPCVLFMRSENWKPTQASDFMFLSWNYDGQSIEPNGIAHVILKLSVSTSVHSFTDFSFTISILGADDPLPWDVNNDNYVGVEDIVIVIQAFDSHSGDSHWNSDFDVSFDGVIDIVDIVEVSNHLGKYL